MSVLGTTVRCKTLQCCHARAHVVGCICGALAASHLKSIVVIIIMDRPHVDWPNTYPPPIGLLNLENKQKQEARNFNRQPNSVDVTCGGRQEQRVGSFPIQHWARTRTCPHSIPVCTQHITMPPAESPQFESEATWSESKNARVTPARRLGWPPSRTWRRRVESVGLEVQARAGGRKK